jgi:hypothetical protein
VQRLENWESVMVRPAKLPSSRSARKRVSSPAAASLAEAKRIRAEHNQSIADAGWSDKQIDAMHKQAIASPAGQRLIKEIRAERDQRQDSHLRAIPRRNKRTGRVKP